MPRAPARLAARLARLPPRDIGAPSTMLAPSALTRAHALSGNPPSPRSPLVPTRVLCFPRAERRRGGDWPHASVPPAQPSPRPRGPLPAAAADLSSPCHPAQCARTQWSVSLASPSPPASSPRRVTPVPDPGLAEAWPLAPAALCPHPLPTGSRGFKLLGDGSQVSPQPRTCPPCVCPRPLLWA